MIGTKKVFDTNGSWSLLLITIWSERFNFANVIFKCTIFLQLNSYCKITIKFFTKNTDEEHETISEKVFEDNTMNKGDLERRIKINIEFQQ